MLLRSLLKEQEGDYTGGLKQQGFETHSEAGFHGTTSSAALCETGCVISLFVNADIA